MMFICLLYVLETGRKTLKLGALRTKNLSQKSVETPKFPERPQLLQEVKIPTSLTETFLTLAEKCLKKNLEKSGK